MLEEVDGQGDRGMEEGSNEAEMIAIVNEEDDEE